MDSGRARDLFTKYAAAMAYVEVELPTGDRSIGSAFHVGEGVFVTARHVVEDNKILEIASTEHTYIRLTGPEAERTLDFVRQGDETYPAHRVENGIMRLKSGPHFHWNEKVDVAVFQVEEIDPYTPVVWLGDHLDDWLGRNDFVLSEAIILGYPPIPMSDHPTLVGARAEVNALVILQGAPHVHFVLSSMPRGGFSGGVAISESRLSLGVVTRSLMSGDVPTELGFMTVTTVEPIYICLADCKLLPDVQAEGWDGFWNSMSLQFRDPKKPTPAGVTRVAVTVEHFDDGRRFALTIICNDDAQVLQSFINTVENELADYELVRSEIRPGMHRIDIRWGGIETSERVIATGRAVTKMLIQHGYEPIDHGGDMPLLSPE